MAQNRFKFPKKYLAKAKMMKNILQKTSPKKAIFMVAREV